ncbi:PepSY-associated TM helix domain-containing protein [Stutzerimonas azotifigens]|uniref:PepSY-associated TM helix domain-containing protein n=1 Tax=Stutzerimonas azotifigens TaxID=291995 RepID=UPI000422BB3B|nr:PepSY-associated TM helix domain-containing protein [Stutzerimonas azotifigens]
MERQRSLTQSMSWLHTWAGLLLGWALFAIFLTGTLAVFDKEIDWWMQPELSDRGLGQAQAAEVAQRWLEREKPQASGWNIGLPTERAPQLSVSSGEQRRGERTQLDPATGEALPVRETVGGNFFFHFHYTLHLPRMIGIWVVGFAAMAMLVAIISGVIIHKKIFKDFFTFRPAKGQRSWLDGHNASAVLLLPFHLMITYSGLAIFSAIYMPAAVDALYDGDRQAMFRESRPGAEQAQQAGGGARRAGAEQGQPRGRGEGARPQAPAAELLPLAGFIERGEAHYGEGMVAGLSVSNPGRADARVTVRPLLGSRIELTKGEGMVFDGVSGRLLDAPEPSRPSLLTQRVIAGLHFAQFGGYPMRWLYFLCGLVSCVMIASGLVLYTVKKRRQVKADSSEGRAFLRLVESLNVAAVAGLSLACAALLWGNRLLPAELAGREFWELRLFFGVWLLSLAHARLRAPLQAWREQLFVAAALGVALPLLDLLLAPGAADRARLGLDVTALLLGATLAWVAWQLPRIATSRARRTPAVQIAGAER